MRCDSVRIGSRRNVRIESNRKVPQTNRLSLGVLDMDGRWRYGDIMFETHE